ncbi:MAG: hypothetical protein LBI84_01960, partial [Propionibacteriaceae bacterium]|nr:hypothetical protein [Propionibacteriaceae bacterium]
MSSPSCLPPAAIPTCVWVSDPPPPDEPWQRLRPPAAAENTARTDDGEERLNTVEAPRQPAAGKYDPGLTAALACRWAGAVAEILSGRRPQA